MALIGSIEHFKSGDDFKSYMERMEQFFIVNEVPENRKVAMFITLIGPESYGILKDLISPESPANQTYARLVETLTKHYSPTKLVIAERYVFYKCLQKPEQSLREFIIEIRNLAQSCEFGEFLSQALRDKFVCGVRSEHIQRRLLTEAELTFEKAISIAKGMESADKQSKLLQPASSNVFKVMQQRKCGQGNNFEKSGPSKQYRTEYKTRQNSQFNKANNQSNFKECWRCGRHHNVDECPARNWKCFACSKVGHTSKKCRSRSVKVVDEENGASSREVDEAVPDEEYTLGNINKVGHKESHVVQVNINNVPVSMEIDTGACRSVMHVSDYKKYFSNCELSMPKVKLRSVVGDQLDLAGEMSVEVKYNNMCKNLKIVIIKSNEKFMSLMGRDWLEQLCPEWRGNFSSSVVGTVSQNSKNNVVDRSLQLEKQKLVREVKTRFNKLLMLDRSSYINTFYAQLQMKDAARPIFHKPYSVPYALKSKVEAEIQSLESSGIIRKVQYSDWASPIVIVPKDNGELRLCVDYKVTVNKMLDTDHYPLPLPEDIFNSLCNSKVFCVIDLGGAYQQLRLDSISKDYLTINTHLGLYQPNRLQFGVSSGPSIFQSVMDRILQGITDVYCYIDDIIIKGETLSQCHETLVKVFQRLCKYNVRINWDKCKFFEEEIQFLGYKINSRGLKPMEDKVFAIVNAPIPDSVQKLQSYLGLLNYYSRFLPNLSEILHPLYKLLQKNEPYVWSEDCQRAFDCSKKILVQNKLVVHYNPSKELFVTCDASSYGIGAVLSHKIDGEPIYFASSTMSKAQRNYSQIEREALALVFAVKKFHKFLYGRNFTLITDHLPLKSIFDSNKKIPVTAAGRIQRWSVFLSGYNYQILHKKGTLIPNADALSRLPLKCEVNIPEHINCFNMSETIPLSYNDIANNTKKDVVLSKVYDYVHAGWPEQIHEEVFQPYFKKRAELSTEQGCIVWGSRVVVPLNLRIKVLELFHNSHSGIVQTKMLMRNFCWWPKMNDDIEKIIMQCSKCQEFQNYKINDSLCPWAKTGKNFERIHVDFFVKNQVTYLLIVDSFSKWIDIHIMSGTTASQTIEKLCKTFATVGLPLELVSDNGPPFTSSEFIKFLLANDIKPIKSPPYHAQSNGIAERTVQTVKKALNKQLQESKYSISIEMKLQHFLFHYRNTPNSTGMSPNEYLFKQKPRTVFDLLKPSCNPKSRTNIKLKERNLFNVGQMVLCQTIQGGRKWIKGRVIKIISNVVYLVNIDGNIKQVHAGHMKPCFLEELEADRHYVTNPNNSNIPMVSDNVPERGNATLGDTDNTVTNNHDLVLDNASGHSLPSADISIENQTNRETREQADFEGFDLDENNSVEAQSGGVRRSQRTRRPVVRLDL